MTTGASLREAARERNFWILLFIFVGLSFVLNGVIPHLVPMLMDRGFAADRAALVASVFGLSSFVGRILIGTLVDRFDARRVAVLFIGLSAVGIAFLALNLPLWGIILAALLLGGTLGAEVDLLAFLVSRYFGLACFAHIFGTMFGIVMIGMGLGPVAFGLVYDGTGSYQAILAAGVPVCLAAMAAMHILGPYKIPDELPRPVRS